jgi:hypothetical protein
MDTNIDAMGVGNTAVDDDPHRNSIEHFRIDNSDTIRDIDLELRGYEQNPLTRIWEKPPKPDNLFGMSEKCRKFIISSYRIIMNKANVQGALLVKYHGAKEYQWKVDSLSETFELALIYRMEEYNVNINDIHYLATQYQETIRTFFTRIFDDGERKRDRPQETYIHRDDMNRDDKKWGLG